MRIRHLSTYLSEQKLLRTAHLRSLRSMRLGIEAVYWLRTVPGLKDPFADAICGFPPPLFDALDHHLEAMDSMGITASFVFPGMQPRSHMLFSSNMHVQMDEGWEEVARGNSVGAQHRFAQATSRVNSDFVHAVFHYLKSKECDVVQAPYFSTAQLAHYVNEEFLDAVFGPPALLLFGVPRVIVSIDYEKKTFEFVELSLLLDHWQISHNQFINACLLAGTEYCLTFPYLNLLQFHHGQSNFSFATAVEFIRQAPFGSYMQHFPNEEMRNDHFEGYCVCKTLITCSLVLGSQDGSILRLAPNKCLTDNNNNNNNNNNNSPNDKRCDGLELPDNLKPKEEDPALLHSKLDWTSSSSWKSLPKDYHKVIGARLPRSIYYLMGHGILSRKLPTVLALGEWFDYGLPTVDSVEYRELLTDIRQYRCKALGLLAAKMHPFFRTRPIRFSRGSPCQDGAPPDSELPDLKPLGMWHIDAGKLMAEKQRQQRSTIDLGFCVRWHEHARSCSSSSSGNEIFSACKGEDDRNIQPPPENLEVLLALSHFGLLESLSYFTDDGGRTVFGSVLSRVHGNVEEILFVLEMMKFGLLSGDSTEPTPERPYPEHLPSLKLGRIPPLQRKPFTLLTRVFSLYPATLFSDRIWSGPIDFDLAAFHSILKVLKRSLRQVGEAVLGGLLMNNMEKVRMLGSDFLDPRNPRVPIFAPQRNCLGIVAGTFLEFTVEDNIHTDDINNGNARKPPWVVLEAILKRNYACLVNPIEDLLHGIGFWNQVKSVIVSLKNSLNINELHSEFEQADVILKNQIERLSLNLHPKYNFICKI